MNRFLFLAAGMFAMGFEDYLFAGLLPAISSSLQASIVAVAQGCAVYGLAYILAVPLCAILLSKISVRSVLILAIGLFIIGNLLTLFSTNLPSYIFSRFVSGLAVGLYLPVAVAAVATGVERDFQGRALSLMWGSNSAGAVVGVPLGLWISHRLGWRVTVMVIVALALATLTGLLLSKQAFRKSPLPPSLGDQFRLLLDPDILVVICVTLLTATGCLGLYSFISEVLTGSANSSDLAFSFWSVGGLIGSIGVGYAVDRFAPSQNLMILILSMLLVAIIIIPLARTVPLAGLLPFLIWGAMGWGSVMPQQCSLIRMRPGHEAILVALNSSVVSLGAAIGTGLGGIALSLGVRAEKLPYVTAALVFCALVLQLGIVFLRKPKYETAQS